MNFSKLMSVLLVAGILGWNAFAVEDERDDAGDAGQVKTMQQAWEMATKPYEDEPGIKKEVVDFYKANFAEKIKYLEMRLKDEPDEVVQELQDDLEECSEILSLKDEDPEEFKKRLDYMVLENRTELLGDKIFTLKEEDAIKNKDEIEKLSKELKAGLEKLFDLEIQMEKDALKALAEEIKIREQNRKKIIQSQFNELIGVEDDL